MTLPDDIVKPKRNENQDGGIAADGQGASHDYLQCGRNQPKQQKDKLALNAFGIKIALEGKPAIIATRGIIFLAGIGMTKLIQHEGLFDLVVRKIIKGSVVMDLVTDDRATADRFTTMIASNKLLPLLNKQLVECSTETDACCVQFDSAQLLYLEKIEISRDELYSLKTTAAELIEKYERKLIQMAQGNAQPDQTSLDVFADLIHPLSPLPTTDSSCKHDNQPTEKIMNHGIADNPTTHTINIGGANIETINVTLPNERTEKGPNEDQPKTSLKNYIHPTKNFVRKESYENIKRTQIKKHISVLHICGPPGSGKSEIVRQLAVEFPYNNKETLSVKHQINCSDDSEDVVESLRKLLDAVYDHNLLQRNDAWKSAGSSLEMRRTADYVNLLVLANVPILIIIEDPPHKHRDLLRDFMRVLDTLHCNKPVHVYITSKSRSICENSDVKCYLTHKVGALTTEESLDLWDPTQIETEENKQAAEKISEILSGLPLGLITVKASCRKTRKSLSAYLRWLEDFPLATHRMEREHVEELGSQHLFQCMIKLLDSKFTSLWKTMCILVMFHHGAIPQRLIGKIMEFQREKSDEDLDETGAYIEQKSSEFISEVEDFGICNADGNDFADTLVSFHRVVFVAVRLHLKEKRSFFLSLRQAVLVVSDLVHKDMRTAKNLAFMKSMQPHVERVLRFVNDNPSICQDFVVNMAVSHLYEVLGVIKQPIEPAEESLVQSARLIWTEVAKFVTHDMVFDDIINKQAEDVGNYAKRLTEVLIKAGETLKSKPDDFDKYISLVVQFKSGEAKFFQDLCLHKEAADFVEKVTRHSLRITTGKLSWIRGLESGILFLNRNSHCTVFFVERMASILYSLGRVVIRNGKTISEAQREKFVWISDVAHALCMECEEITGVRLLFLRRGAVAKVAVRLKGIGALGDAKKGVLLGARPVVERLVDENITREQPYFENGLRKSMDKAFEDMTCLRYVVRTDMKLMPLSTHKEQNERRIKADVFCKQLLKVANENKQWQLSPKCVVYCGKYMASKGNYLEAAHHFRDALADEAIVSDKGILFPWTCCNYARAIVSGELSDLVADAMEKCSEALMFRDKIEDHLIKKLEYRFENLNHFASSLP